MERNKGISLIVLVITIIVIIILAGSVILSLANNNPIAQATEASFKANIDAYNSELTMSLSTQYLQIPGFNPDQFYVKPWDGTGDGTGTVKQYIPSLTASEGPNYVIAQGKLQYIGTDSKQKQWAKNIGITDGLVSYFKMNGDVTESNQGLNGTINGTVLNVNDRFGNANSALELGSAGFSNIISKLPPFNNATTFCAWIYPKKYPTEKSTLVLGETPGSGNSFYMSLNTDGSLQSYWYETNPAGYHRTAANVIPLNQWSFVCTSWDGSYNKLYVNGQLLNTVAVTGAGRTQIRLNIGAEDFGRQYFGAIDDVRIYNRALSQTEIQNIYNNIF